MERRTFLLSSLMAAVAVKLAKASPIDPNQTFVLQREDIKFMPVTGLPPASGEMAKLYGDLNGPGPYLAVYLRPLGRKARSGLANKQQGGELALADTTPRTIGPLGTLHHR
jgi:hypothetical protein